MSSSSSREQDQSIGFGIGFHKQKIVNWVVLFGFYGLLFPTEVNIENVLDFWLEFK